VQLLKNEDNSVADLEKIHPISLNIFISVDDC